MSLDFEIVGATHESSQQFECLVSRVRLPIHDAGKRAYLCVDVDLPPQYRDLAARRLFNADGTCRVEALLKDNRKSLAPFFESGDAEWDVRGME